MNKNKKEKIKEDYLITIDGVQQGEGDPDMLSFSTFGDFYKKCDDYYITYNESEATGFEGNVTTLKIEDNHRVTLERVGSLGSQIIIEKDKKHLCHYMTDFGDIVIGVSAMNIDNKLSDEGGNISFKYSLDINASELATNELNINVRKM